MSVFGGQYASNYDLFYADKDYAAEAAFVQDVIHRHNPRANSLLEFGCGSARHAVELVRSRLPRDRHRSQRGDDRTRPRATQEFAAAAA